MNRWIWIPVIMVSAVAFVLGFEHVYDYVVWDIPFSKIKTSDIDYTYDYAVNYSDFRILSPTVSHSERIGDSMRITFNKNGFFMGKYEIPNEFEYVGIVAKNGTFISLCHDSDGNGIFRATIFHLAEMHDDHAVFRHYGVYMPPDLPCKYPEIIEKSIGAGIRVPEPVHRTIP